jgi:hypothetical protein
VTFTLGLAAAGLAAGLVALAAARLYGGHLSRRASAELWPVRALRLPRWPSRRREQIARWEAELAERRRQRAGRRRA